MESGSREKPLDRAEEAEQLLETVKNLVTDFIRSADNDTPFASQTTSANGTPISASALLTPHSPSTLQSLLPLPIPTQEPLGLPGLHATAHSLLSHSVNTWHQGFLDKLYHSPQPVGLAADLLLTALNTNVHIYSVSPALTLIEKQTTRALARMFGFQGRWAGGVSQSGGSAGNATAMVVARNTLFPETKMNGLGGRRWVIFTSEHGHYSLEKAAQIQGFGSQAVRSIPVDEEGRMRPDALDSAIQDAKKQGETVFFVNATAGTTVLGSFDPLHEIADICQREGVWMHVDASWGGPVIFSERYRGRLRGAERADSLAVCAHKMMGVPLTCSILLGRDLRLFRRAMTLPAGYLFHGDEEKEEGEQVDGDVHASAAAADGEKNEEEEDDDEDFWDLADLTPQCGRRGDILKLALSWIYYGTSGYAAYIDHAFAMIAYMVSLLTSNSRFTLVSSNPPPCLQVCFYFDKQSGLGGGERNSRITALTKTGLLKRGFMIDYAPGEEGKFFRVVLNGQTRRETVEGLVRAVEEVGDAVVTRVDGGKG